MNPNLNLVFEHGTDRNVFNLPTFPQISALLPPDFNEPDFEGRSLRSVILYRQGGGLQIIDPRNGIYMPIHYTLLFPRSDLGFHYGITHNLPAGQERRWVSIQEYYRYRLFSRQNETQYLFQARRLFQQCLVDAWASR